MTSTEELRELFDKGISVGATHMIMVCDTFSHEDYPVYVRVGQDAREVAKEFDGINMQRLLEVYNLKMDKTVQFQSSVPVFNYDTKGPQMLEPLTIVVRGNHDTGRTTVASFIKMFLEENGFKSVMVKDTPPLPDDQKKDFLDRLTRNRQRPIQIVVELEE